MNDIQRQLNQIAKKIEKETQMTLTPDELFSSDFMLENHIYKTIREIFNDADVDISHIKSLSENEKQQLMSVLSSTKFTNWDDFIQAAGAFQVKKKLRSLGLLH